MVLFLTIMEILTLHMIIDSNPNFNGVSVEALFFLKFKRIEYFDNL